MKTYALFSVNGRFIGYTNFKPVNGLYKELPDNFDPVMQVYVGDYATGEIKHIYDLQVKDYRESNYDQKWKVLESELNFETSKKITDSENMPLYRQLNAIMETLYLNKDKIQLSEEFMDIYNRIDDIRRRHKQAIETYKEAPKADFISKEEERAFYDEYTQKQLSVDDVLLDQQS
jgi:hypothetical protein